MSRCPETYNTDDHQIERCELEAGHSGRHNARMRPRAAYVPCGEEGCRRHKDHVGEHISKKQCFTMLGTNQGKIIECLFGPEHVGSCMSINNPVIRQDLGLPKWEGEPVKADLTVTEQAPDRLEASDFHEYTRKLEETRSVAKANCTTLTAEQVVARVQERTEELFDKYAAQPNASMDPYVRAAVRQALTGQAMVEVMVEVFQQKEKS